MSENYEREIVIRNTIYWVHYPEMENCINDILVKNSLKGKGDVDGTYGSFNIDNKEINMIPYDENLGIVINSKTYESVINRLKSIISLDALPFYDKWKDLTVLYEYIKDKESREELSEVLGQFWQFKKATILRLCNDKGYQEFMNSFVKRRAEILELRPESVDVQRYYNAAKELKEVLDKTEPIYNL